MVAPIPDGRIARGIRLAPALDRHCHVAHDLRKVVLSRPDNNAFEMVKPPRPSTPLEAWPVEVTP